MGRKQAIHSITKTERDRYLKDRGVTLLGGGMDEAPQAYKPIEQVIGAQSDLIDIIGKFAPLMVRNVMSRLKQINETMGTGLIVVEQNVPATLKLIDRAVILKSGRIVFDGKEAELEAQKDLWQWF